MRTGAEADAETIAEFGGGTVVVAIGGRGRIPDIPGAGLPHVIDLRDWLRLDDDVPERCTIWGADREGVAVADHLAEQGSEILIVGAQPSLARWSACHLAARPGPGVRLAGDAAGTRGSMWAALRDAASLVAALPAGHSRGCVEFGVIAPASSV